MKEKGMNLGEFQIKLLKKIEELTLYRVQQWRTIREQQKAASRKDAEIAALQQHNAILDARLATVEQIMPRLAMREERK